MHGEKRDDDDDDDDDDEPKRPTTVAARRAARRRAEFQVIQKFGREVFAKQVTHPITKRRQWVHADTKEELFARVDEIRRLRRNARLGIVSQADAMRAAGTALGRIETFREAWNAYERTAPSKHWKSSLRAYWLHHVGARLGSCTLLDLTEEKMNAFFLHMREKEKGRDRSGRPTYYSENTLTNVWFTIVACIECAISRKVIAERPWGNWKFKPSKDRVTKLGEGRDGFENVHELNRAYVVAAAMAERAWREQGIIPDLHHRMAVMAFLGLRCGEAIALTWNAIKVQPDGSIRVEITKQARRGWQDDPREAHEIAEGIVHPATKPKAGKTRTLRAQADHPVVRVLAYQLALLRKLGFYHPFGPVFPGPRGGFRRKDCLRPEKMKEIARRAGLERPGRKWVQHGLRHSTARMGAAMGTDPRQMQKFMGHAALETTEVYYGDAGKFDAMIPTAPRETLGAEIHASLTDEEIAKATGDAAPRVLLAPLEEPVTFDAEAALAEPEEIQRDRARKYYERSLGRSVRGVARYVDLTTSKVPREVKALADQAYRNAYKRARRHGLTIEEQREAGWYARRSMLGSYGAAKAAALIGGRGEKARARAAARNDPFPGIDQPWADASDDAPKKKGRGESP